MKPEIVHEQNQLLFLQSVLESPQDIIIFALDTHYCYIEFTKYHKAVMKQIWGVEIAKGVNMLEVITVESDREKARANFDRAMKGESFSIEEEYGDATLQRSYYENRYSPVVDTQGNTIGVSVFVLDITKRHLAEEEIRSSELKYRTLLNNINVGIKVFDTKGNVILCNPKALEITNLTEGQIKGKEPQNPYWKALTPDGSPLAIDEYPINVILNSGKPLLDFMLGIDYAPGHKPNWVIVNGYPVMDNKGKVQEVVITMSDINELVQTQQEVRDNQERLNEAQQLASIGSLELHVGTNDLIWSSQLYRIYEIEEPQPKEKLFKLYKAKLPNDDNARLDKLVRHAIATGDDFTIEHRIIMNDGRVKYIQGICKTVKNEAGKVVLLRGTGQDITERKKQEEAINQSHELLQKLTDKVGAAIYQFEFDNNGGMSFPFMSKGISMVSPGITAEDVMENYQSAFRLIHPEDINRLMESIEESRRTLKDWLIEFRLLIEGKVRWISGSSRAEQKENGTIVWYGYLQDITEKKENEHMMKNLLMETISNNNRLTDFAHIVSHNLRSHSANITGLLNVYDLAENEQEKATYIEYLKSTSVKLSETIDNLNEIITIQNNKFQELTPLNLKQEIEKTLYTIRYNLLENQTTLFNLVDETVTVNVIPAYLDSILLNILTNAVKYKSPERKLNITITCVREDNFMVLRIADNGLGIDMKRHGTKIFGMYKTFHGNLDARGLGLFLTKTQIEAMKGRIEVESNLGKGSVFSVYFKYG